MTKTILTRVRRGLRKAQEGAVDTQHNAITSWLVWEFKLVTTTSQGHCHSWHGGL